MILKLLGAYIRMSDNNQYNINTETVEFPFTLCHETEQLGTRRNSWIDLVDLMPQMHTSTFLVLLALLAGKYVS